MSDKAISTGPKADFSRVRISVSQADIIFSNRLETAKRELAMKFATSIDNIVEF